MTDNDAPARPRSRPGRPSRQDAAETSTRIIDAAARLFAAQGFAATSMEQVASACNAGKDTIYRRFPSKLALFGAVVERTRDRILTRLEGEISAAPQTGDPLEHLRRVARWFLTINLDPELLAFRRIALSEETAYGEPREQTPTDDPIMERLIAAVGQAQEAGVLRSGDTRFLAWHLLHCIVYGPSNDAMLGSTAYATVEAQDRYFNEAWSLFLTGAGTSLS